jgi:hypothetical protein
VDISIKEDIPGTYDTVHCMQAWKSPVRRCLQRDNSRNGRSWKTQAIFQYSSDIEAYGQEKKKQASQTPLDDPQKDGDEKSIEVFRSEKTEDFHSAVSKWCAVFLYDHEKWGPIEDGSE